MGFKEVQDLSPDTVVSLGGKNRQTGKLNPTQVEGYYLGKRSVADKKKKSGLTNIYVFQTSKGNVGVWGKTDLDRKMEGVALGVMLRITSTGTRPTPNGDMYTYKVEFDDSNTIEVTSAGGNTTSDWSEETYSDEGSEESYGTASEEQESEEYEEPVQVAKPAVSAAARKAEVQRILSAGKAKKA